MSTDSEIMAIALLLARYLRDNPNACDTPDAIARWWLGSNAVLNTPTLEAALHWLEQRRLVEPLRAADGRVRYQRINPGPDGDAALDALIQTRRPENGGLSRQVP